MTAPHRGSLLTHLGRNDAVGGWSHHRSLFARMTGSGCHPANGAGGMGPTPGNSVWIYGGTPEQLNLTILRRRFAGMPI